MSWLQAQYQSSTTYIMIAATLHVWSDATDPIIEECKQWEVLQESLGGTLYAYIVISWSNKQPRVVKVSILVL